MGWMRLPDQAAKARGVRVGRVSHAENNFDAIRLMMALLVVWSHSFALYFGSEESEPFSILMNGTYSGGAIAVLVFFIISGFLICQSYERRKTVRDYFERRVRRIYPGYMVATSICAFVVIPLFSSHANLSASEIFKTVGLNLLLHNYFPPSDVFDGQPLNGSLWSIPFEFWCYIGLALLGLSRIVNARWTIVVIVFLTILIRIWLDLTGRKPGGGVVQMIIGWQYTWFTVLPCFLAGTLLYLYRDVVPRNGLIALAGIIVLICVAHLPLPPLPRKCIVNMLFVPVIAYSVIYAAFSPAIKLHNTARFGDFSYGTYLYAYPIQEALLFVFGHKLPFPLYVAMSISLALIAGVLSWFSVERWFLAKKKSRLYSPARNGHSLGARRQLATTPPD
jgi:peptidoglycan/LPS O-acetylase OafA/YrhL